jgi:hypothetical protein
MLNQKYQLRKQKGGLVIMPNAYAPIPEFDQSVEYVTQAEPVAQDDGTDFYDVVINPISLDDQDLTNPQTIIVLASGYENVISLGRDVSQDDLDTLQQAADDSGADVQKAAAINKILNGIVVFRPRPIITPTPIIKIG